MVNKISNELDFFKLIDKFYQDAYTGKRIQKNGKRFSENSLIGYKQSIKTLKEFCESTGFHLRFRIIKSQNKREIERERRYWVKFYFRFNRFLYKEKDYSQKS